MSENTNAFDEICGNCEGIDILAIDEASIREMAGYYGCSKEQIRATIPSLVCIMNRIHTADCRNTKKRQRGKKQRCDGVNH